MPWGVAKFLRLGELAISGRLRHARWICGDRVRDSSGISGDGYWHVAAFKVGHVAEVELRQLAERFGGASRGCSRAVLGDGSVPNPNRPLD